jgi:hypothetical protein
VTVPAVRPDRGYPGYESWPHPKPPPDPVDARLVRVIRRVLAPAWGGRPDLERCAQDVAGAVWDWLAEGDS